MQNIKDSHGFTMFELLVVMIVSGLILTMVLTASSQYIKQKKVKDTISNVELAELAIKNFYVSYGYYPCPARGNAKSGDPDYAQSSSGCATTADAIFVGTVPSFAPNPFFGEVNEPEYVKVIGDGMAIDGWGRRLSYAVTSSLAISRDTSDAAILSGGSLNAIHAVVINTIDSSGAGIETNEPFLIVSHGPDGNGAYNRHGFLHAPCDNTAVDGINCNVDPTSAGPHFNITDHRSTSFGANRNDDFANLTTEVAEMCPSGQVATGFLGRTPVCKEASPVLAYNYVDPHNPDPTNEGGYYNGPVNVIEESFSIPRAGVLIFSGSATMNSSPPSATTGYMDQGLYVNGAYCSGDRALAGGNGPFIAVSSTCTMMLQPGTHTLESKRRYTWPYPPGFDPNNNDHLLNNQPLNNPPYQQMDGYGNHVLRYTVIATEAY